MASLSLHRLCLLPPQPLKLSSPFRHHRLTPPPPPTTTTTLSKTPHKTIPPISASSSTSPPATDRLISAASYFFPLLNGVQYGRFLMAQYPIISVPFQPVFPLLQLYHSVPYASFISFFGLYLGIVRNPIFSRYVRFNSLQALVLDVLLVVPLLIHRIFSPGQTGLGMKMTIWMYNALFVFVVACFVYGLVSSVLGKTPYLPFVGEAAGRQLD